MSGTSTRTAADYLGEVRRRSERPLPGSLPISNDAVRFLMESAADVPLLLAAVEVALAGHRRSLFPATSGEDRGKHYCLDCTSSIDHQTAYAVWPCRRYAEITTALLEASAA